MSTLTPSLVWSEQQEEIYRWIERGQGSAVIEAVAGSGKTTTAVEAASRVNEFLASSFVAFNKSVADQLTRRLPSHVPACTLNALGYRAWRSYVGTNVPVDGKKVFTLTRQLSEDSNKDFQAGVRKLVSLAKMRGIVPPGTDAVRALAPDTTDIWDGLIEEYGLDFGWGDREDEAIRTARRVLTESIRAAGKSIDFDDQLYLPVIFDCDFPQNDFLFVDEAQDLNGIQCEMVEASLAPGGRFVGVGDGSQAIYGWRGAGRGIEDLAARFKCARFPLTVSYRCAKAVIKEAQKYVPHIQAAPDAPEGKVEALESWGAQTFRPSDVILCRNNAPLVSMAFKLIAQGVACTVLGREIGSGLVALVKKLKPSDLRDLTSKLDSYLSKEWAKSDGDDAAAQNVADKVATLRIFIEAARAVGGTIEQLCMRIQAMFQTDEPTGLLTLSSVHKAKGLEWDRVFILNRELIGMRAKTTAQMQAEKNVAYVAITRAKVELYYIHA